MKALPTCDLSDKVLCKLLSVLEVCFGLCMQKRQGLFREASRVRLGKRCEKLKFYSENKDWKRCYFFPHWLGIPFKAKTYSMHRRITHQALQQNLTWMKVLHILSFFYLFEE